jgi:hypothetical protein
MNFNKSYLSIVILTVTKDAPILIDAFAKSLVVGLLIVSCKPRTKTPYPALLFYYNMSTVGELK